jgi:hypothetical protein
VKTTLYGNGKETNEFGHPKVAKETNFLRPVYFTKDPVSLSTLRDMLREFHEAHGCYPETLHVAGQSNGTRSLMFQAEGPGQGPFVSLKVFFDAAETHVE